MLFIEDPQARDRRGTLDRVPQFPHVPGPGPRLQRSQCPCRRSGRRLSRRRRAPQQVSHQGRDVFNPLTQWSQVNAKGPQPIKEILAKPPFPQLVLQHAIGRRDNANVNLPELRRPDGVQFSLLENAQQLDLQRGSDVGDFVEKHRPARGLREQSRAVTVGSRKRTAGVAKQLGLDQAGVEGGNAHGHERLGGPRTVPMNCPGHQLFARAAFAGDQHGSGGARGQRDLLVDLLHGRRMPDQPG